ncbi:AbrB family transcriptional regulator [Methylobacterium sp. PvR107]|uniref:AbrB/MazE/SpoVT family DNA-binding domain-containing protein n=1 Tax=Methylobacterium sp. PvR107 TaxID=2806597 RepID=UPI001AE9B833|nr:AbrB family transcriptional regulator [Methylobacterium sp. PvR107]MBP1179035.1 bifunctional DNA-binding transcriptional regulator/antitoxin component of YhaV-PrlF toxin-antitoxin module [Methylobacterium sp. PvR107]
MPDQSARTAHSQVSVKSQTVLPAAVLEHLAIGPDDRLRYRITPDGIRIDKAPPEGEDPFAAFTEWAGPIDDEDYAGL